MRLDAVHANMAGRSNVLCLHKGAFAMSFWPSANVSPALTRKMQEALRLACCVAHSQLMLVLDMQATVTRRQSSRASKSRAMSSLKTALQNN